MRRHYNLTDEYAKRQIFDSAINLLNGQIHFWRFSVEEKYSGSPCRPSQIGYPVSLSVGYAINNPVTSISVQEPYPYDEIEEKKKMSEVIPKRPRKEICLFYDVNYAVNVALNPGQMGQHYPGEENSIREGIREIPPFIVVFRFGHFRENRNILQNISQSNKICLETGWMNNSEHIINTFQLSDNQKQEFFETQIGRTLYCEQSRCQHISDAINEHVSILNGIDKKPEAVLEEKSSVEIEL